MDPASSPLPPTRSKAQRVSSQHTLERVRNNQRQHRARQRAYVASLEDKLREAEHTIDTLRHQLEALQATHAQCNHNQKADSRVAPQGTTASTSTNAYELPFDLTTVNGAAPLPTIFLPTYHAVSDELPTSHSDSLTHQREDGVNVPEHDEKSNISHTDRILPQIFTDSIVSPLPSLDSYPSQGAPAGLPFEAIREHAMAVATMPYQPFTPPYDPCSYLQQNVNSLHHMVLGWNPENPSLLFNYISLSAMEAHFKTSTSGESTILCSEAYLLVSQKRLKKISQHDVTTWLCNGFRKALQPGAGCRVRTDTFLSLLAFIGQE